jgi:hypothetical protein
VEAGASSVSARTQIIRPRPLVLALGALFISYHLAATLVTSAPPALHDPLWPLFESYGAGLRMTARFGVFAHYTAHTSVAVYGVESDGRRHLLSHSSPARRGAADARITKIQRKFLQQETRELFGQAYLAYFCRTARERGLELDRTELELERELGAEGSEVVLTASCRRRDE